MREAVRPLIADPHDLTERDGGRVGALLDIEAQTKLLLAEQLTDTQRRAVQRIARRTRELTDDLTSAPLDAAQRGAAGSAHLPAESPADRTPMAGLRPEDSAHPHVLIADDDDEMLELLSEILAERYELTLAHDGAEALAALAANTFSLAIVDLNLPILDGFGVAEAIRASERAAPPFMFLSAQSAPEFKVRGLALGAADYVTKPFDPDELTARIARIIAAVTREASLRAEAMTDSLTGLCNYRSFTTSLLREVERSRRYGQPLSLLTIDLDHLKAINDAHGHDVGNDAILRLAQTLKKAVRRFDVVARHGGDEFAVLLPNTDGAEALMLAQRLREQLRAQPLRGERLTVSIGVGFRDESQDLDGDALVKASDEALYSAKRAGRDRVEISSSATAIK
jgi:two-component system cell cycle response regulator